MIFAALSIAAGCEKTSEISAEALSFDDSKIRVQVEEYRQVTVFGTRNGEKFIMDNSDIEWTSSNPEFVTIVQGVLYAREVGKSVITAEFGGLSAALEVSVKDGDSTTGIDARFSQNNIYDLGHKTAVFSGIQSFGLDRNGDIFYIQNGASPAWYENYLTKVKPSSIGSDRIEGTMKFYYLGHPTSMAVEDGSDGETYIWVPEFSSKTVSPTSSSYKEYWGAKAIARIKYVPGTTLYPWDESIEYFWFGHPDGDINVAIDFDEGTLAVTYHIYTYLGETRRVFTYDLAEVMAAPLVKKALNITYGGDGAPNGKEVTELKEVTVHDCSGLTPKGHMGIPTDKRDGINTYDWQGFEYNGGLVYFVEGTSYLSMGGSRCALTVFDMNGEIYEKRTFVRVIQDPEELKAFNITTTGAIESEGVKIWRGEMYLGFASGGYMGQSGTRANIFKYKKSEN